MQSILWFALIASVVFLVLVDLASGLNGLETLSSGADVDELTTATRLLRAAHLDRKLSEERAFISGESIGSWWTKVTEWLRVKFELIIAYIKQLRVKSNDVKDDAATNDAAHAKDDAAANKAARAKDDASRATYEAARANYEAARAYDDATRAQDVAALEAARAIEATDIAAYTGANAEYEQSMLLDGFVKTIDLHNEKNAPIMTRLNKSLDEAKKSSTFREIADGVNESKVALVVHEKQDGYLLWILHLKWAVEAKSPKDVVERILKDLGTHDVPHLQERAEQVKKAYTIFLLYVERMSRATHPK
uniref:RXLR effector n=1 Tax=Hyaloperonospora arabidopsidis TaxID=272952 RepID=F6MEZ5_HYAAB|nr:RXLR effector [Hyaloperonospora arabidopsidis]